MAASMTCWRRLRSRPSRSWFRRTTGQGFHREIERDYVVVLEGAKQTAANSWREVALGDVAEIVMGQSPPGDKVSGDNGLALLNGPTEFGASHPTPVQFTIDARKYAQPGDILFCVRESTTGRMNWADQEYAIGRGIAAIRHKNASALQPFVRGVIELGLSELLAQATGSTFPTLPLRSDLRPAGHGRGETRRKPWESRSVVVPRVSSLGHRAPVVHPGTLEVLRHDNGIAVRRNEGRQPGFNQAHPIRRSCPAPVLREHSPSPAWRKPSGSEAVAGDIAHRWSRQSGRENFH